MSAPDAGLRRPQAASRSVSTTIPAPSPTEPRSERNVSGLGSHVTDVVDANRVVECSQVERQLGFQRLVRHYLSQVLYGCKSAYCATPTCLSCQKRNAPRPLRPPTQLTARALAHYLARQDDPRRGLCSHELKVHPNSLEIDGALGARLYQAQDGSRQCSVYPSPMGVVDAHVGSHTREGAPLEAGSTVPRSSSHAQQHLVDALKKRRQTRKDTKSLAQNLHDSVSMIYAYSKQLPSSTLLFQSLRSSSPSQHNATPSSSSSDAQSQTGTGATSQGVTPGVRANSATVTSPVNMTASSDHQHSQPNSLIRASPPTSAVLSDGQQVHRIPYHIRGSPKLGKTSKVTAQAALDGTDDPSKLSIAKTRKASHFSEEEPLEMGRNISPSLLRKDASATGPPSARARAAIPVLSTLSCSSLEALKDDVYDHRKDQLPDDFSFSVDYDTNRHFQPSKPFANRSLFYTLSDPDTLLKSFRDPSKAFEDSPLSHLDSARLSHSFRDWSRHNGALVFDSLWIALKALFTPPPELASQKSPRLAPSRKGAPMNSSTDGTGDDPDSTKQRYLDNIEAAHIIMICIHALTSSVSMGWPHTWAQLRKFRAWGVILPDGAPNNDDYMHPYLTIIDELEYEPAIRLAEHLLRAIGVRTCFERILSNMKKQADEPENNASPTPVVDIIVQHLVVVERVALASKRRMTSNGIRADDPGWTVSSVLLEWLKTVITKRWDSKLEMNKWSSVGSAVLLLQKLCNSGRDLNLRPDMCEIPFFNERFDAVEEPVRYLDWEPQPNTLHILQYPDLFPDEYLVKYFRTINFTSMLAQYDQTIRTKQMQGLLQRFLAEPHNWLIRNKMKVTLSDYLLLNVSRDQPLKDTLDQLWGLEKRMLHKPLKVQMGVDEGELGADHGGVTYEFFRVVLGEAFKPDHGMFTLDPQTRMTWFQPGTLEPMWKFEMIGIIFSLAVYNGITLPVTLPLALYQFLLRPEPPLHSVNLKDCFELVADGWPELAKRFQELLEFDGDVADVYMREYAFSYEAFGQNIDHDMDEPYPTEAPNTNDSTPRTTDFKLVTNENRAQFVWEYLQHLTYLSVRPQLEAFKQGFMSCLHPRSLTFFTPASLRRLIEGEQIISISGLRNCTRYEDGYSATHPAILMFWRIVEHYSQEDCRHLLEFVTASDRVPVTGYEGITFHIKRVADGEVLPTSSTCFGKLYLPEYADGEKMGRKLLLAIRNSKGFGVV